MGDLEAVGLSIAFIVSLGRYLDSEHFDIETKDKVRLLLIRFFFFLEDYPRIVQDAIGNTSEKVLFRSESRLETLFYKLYFPLGFPISVAILIIQQYFKLGEGGLLSWIAHYQNDAWIGIVWLAAFFLIVTPMLIISFFILVFTPFMFMLLLITETIRRTLLITLNKATNPKTSPFSYFSALLSVIAAGVGLVRHYT
jgi:hypothetical protein